MSKSKKKSIRVLAVVLSVLVVVLLGCGTYIFLNYAKLAGDLGFDDSTVTDEYEVDPDASGLPEASYKGGNVPVMDKSDGIVDILLLGVDNRDETAFTGRSDVTIDLRINTKNKTVKLASFMRDTLVPIEGHDKNKLNTAYYFGSIDLAYQTMEENFGLRPDYYVVVNFYGMEDIINAMGGVDIEIDSNEIENMTKSIKELNKLDADYESPYITNSGMQHLNGRQAVAYMRIRKVGGDAGRIERQQTVMGELFRKAKSIDVGQIPTLLNTLTQYVRTDIPIDQMLSTATTVSNMEIDEIDKFRYPDEYDLGRYKGMSIVQPSDFETEIKKLQDFLLDA